MADLYDMASELEQRDRELAISSTLQRIQATRLHPKGECHNCGEEVKEKALFCDADCGADYDRRMRAKRY